MAFMLDVTRALITLRHAKRPHPAKHFVKFPFVYFFSKVRVLWNLSYISYFCQWKIVNLIRQWNRYVGSDKT